MSDLVELSRVNSRSSQDLVDLSVLSLVCLKDGLNLLLEDQVAETSLSVQLINKSVEFVIQFLLLSLEILHLLQLDFVLPLHVTDAAFDLLNTGLAVLELSLDLVVLGLMNEQFLDHFVVFSKGLLH